MDRSVALLTAAIATLHALGGPAWADPAGGTEPEWPAGSEELLALVEMADVEWQETADPIPSNAGRHTVGDVSVAHSRDGTTVWLDDPRLGRSRLRARGPIPDGALLLPVVDAWTLSEMSAPTDWALLVPGHRWAWLSDQGPFELERAPAAEGPQAGVASRRAPPPGRATLRTTAFLRGMQTCPSGRARCLLFGPPADVAAAEDPRHPVWGTVLEARAAPAIVGDPSSGREVARLGALSIEIDDRPVVGDPWAPRPIRAWLVVGEQRVVAFDAQFLQGFDPTWTLFRYGPDVVVMARDATRIALSRHDPRTGARRGLPTRVEAVAYYHDCDDDEWLAPVLSARGAGFVMLNVESESEAVYWPSPTARGRLVRLHDPRGTGHSGAIRYTFHEDGLAPVF